jgi:hypothetical protein
MAEVTYGFTDTKGVLQEHFVVNEGDTETLEYIKNTFNFANYYPLNLETDGSVLGEAFWTGKRFSGPSPFPSWVWDEEKDNWFAPVPIPEDGKVYFWDEPTCSWILSTEK